ncbi:unnamed protein product [Cyclocybe aegerita]|uniref:Uncharacterized protein n=1 Tax=Cyclocybe aegerita TaxID=1973307 RepID=A0A8S0VVQ6_CYCAE|nr:unnamed protein product [Cyclocybe aegerita]
MNNPREQVQVHFFAGFHFHGTRSLVYTTLSRNADFNRKPRIDPSIRLKERSDVQAPIMPETTDFPTTRSNGGLVSPILAWDILGDIIEQIDLADDIPTLKNFCLTSSDARRLSASCLVREVTIYFGPDTNPNHLNEHGLHDDRIRPRQAANTPKNILPNSSSSRSRMINIGVTSVSSPFVGWRVRGGWAARSTPARKLASSHIVSVLSKMGDLGHLTICSVPLSMFNRSVTVRLAHLREFECNNIPFLATHCSSLELHNYGIDDGLGRPRTQRSFVLLRTVTFGDSSRVQQCEDLDSSDTVYDVLPS